MAAVDPDDHTHFAAEKPYERTNRIDAEEPGKLFDQHSGKTLVHLPENSSHGFLRQVGPVIGRPGGQQVVRIGQGTDKSRLIDINARKPPGEPSPVPALVVL